MSSTMITPEDCQAMLLAIKAAEDPSGCRSPYGDDPYQDRLHAAGRSLLPHNATFEDHQGLARLHEMLQLTLGHIYDGSGPQTLQKLRYLVKANGNFPDFGHVPMTVDRMLRWFENWHGFKKGSLTYAFLGAEAKGRGELRGSLMITIPGEPTIDATSFTYQISGDPEKIDTMTFAVPAGQPKPSHVLFLEGDASMGGLIQAGYPGKYNAIMMHGNGWATPCCRRLFKRVCADLDIPGCAALDWNPSGLGMMSTIWHPTSYAAKALDCGFEGALHIGLLNKHVLHLPDTCMENLAAGDQVKLDNLARAYDGTPLGAECVAMLELGRKVELEVMGSAKDPERAKVSASSFIYAAVCAACPTVGV